jgi:hypothetical protein
MQLVDHLFGLLLFVVQPIHGAGTAGPAASAYGDE